MVFLPVIHLLPAEAAEVEMMDLPAQAETADYTAAAAQEDLL